MIFKCIMKILDVQNEEHWSNNLQYGIQLLDHHKDKRDYLPGNTDQLHPTFKSILNLQWKFISMKKCKKTLG